MDFEKYQDIANHWLERINDFEQKKFEQNVSNQNNLSLHKKQLLEKFRSEKLDSFIEPKEVKTDYGEFFKVEFAENFDYQFFNKKIAFLRLIQDLKLIRGIRHKKEKKLKNSGFKTIFHLKNISEYRQDVEDYIHFFESENLEMLYELIFQRYNSWSSITNFYLSCFFPEKDFLFLDIETMGLGQNVVFLIGMAFLENKKIKILQLLAKDFEQEIAILDYFLSFVKKFKVLVSFNGRSYDYNFLNQRLAYYGLELLPEFFHFDIYHYSKKFFSLVDYKLETVEKQVLNVNREIDIPGALIPEFYELYNKQKNSGFLLPIVFHNKEDLFSLVKIFFEIHKKLKIKNRYDF